MGVVSLGADARAADDAGPAELQDLPVRDPSRGMVWSTAPVASATSAEAEEDSASTCGRAAEAEDEDFQSSPSTAGEPTNDSLPEIAPEIPEHDSEKEEAPASEIPADDQKGENKDDGQMQDTRSTRSPQQNPAADEQDGDDPPARRPSKKHTGASAGAAVGAAASDPERHVSFQRSDSDKVQQPLPPSALPPGRREGRRPSLESRDSRASDCSALPACRRGSDRRFSNFSRMSGYSVYSTASEVAGIVAHCGYYFLAFFVFWFGAHRFDMTGSGEFDPTDVQLMLNGVGRFFRVSFSRPRPRSEQLRERIRQQKIQQKQEELKQKQREEEHQRNMEELEDGMRNSPISAAVGMGQQKVQLGIEAGKKAVGGLVESQVKGECVEATIEENLRQYLPWFTIIQVCACVGLWLWFAFKTDDFVNVTFHADLTGSVLIEERTTTNEFACQTACSKSDACIGVAYHAGPVAQCRLLSQLHADRADGNECSTGRWNWHVYEKRPRQNWMEIMAGLETAYPGDTVLKTFDFCHDRFTTSIFWRLVTYQYTHGGAGHMASNCIMMVLLGVPLEGFHGTGLVALMWLVGVIGGGLNWMALDPYRQALGASGGCFALLGIHLAGLAANWRQMKFRYPTLVLLLLVAAFDLFMYMATFPDFEIAEAKQMAEATSTAHTVHAGGFVAGLLIGMVLNRNVKRKCCGKVLRYVGFFLGAGLIAFVAFWWFTSPLPAVRSLWYPGEEPTCWIGEVCTNADNTACNSEGRMQCVSCKTRECVENWYKDERVFCVSRSSYELCDGVITDVVQNCQNCTQQEV